MGKIGRFVTDPRVGTPCQIQLETILLSHDLGGFGGAQRPFPRSVSGAPCRARCCSDAISSTTMTGAC